MSTPIANHYVKMKEQYPEYFQAVENLGKAAKKSGPLNPLCCELIQLAASLASGSEGGVHSHCKRALDEGASREQIRHAVMILTNTIGFPRMMAGLSWVNDILGNE